MDAAALVHIAAFFTMHKLNILFEILEFYAHYYYYYPSLVIVSSESLFIALVSL